MRVFDFLKEDFGFKALAFILAVMLWFFVTYKGQSEMVIDAPIEFKNTPKGYILMKQSINKVDIHISGHERLLKAMRPIHARVVVDLSNAKKGENEIYFSRDDIVIPRTVKVLRMDPTFMRFTLDEISVKTVPVRVPVIGIPEKGYKVRAIEVIPSSIEIEGAKSEINGITLIKTETVDITGLDRDLQQTVKIHTGGKNIKTKTNELVVKISIVKVHR
ncbi:MAG: CdaR family protein [Thermodesulfovibrionales bacterium]|nr:CdaR family protein [Thermodesulfovibrionales bacterium]